MISIVIPFKNEVNNIPTLINEIAETMDGVADYELVCIDDGSDDGTPEALHEVGSKIAAPLRILQHTRSVGQSTSIIHGVRSARGRLVVTLDGDGQNDPADIPAMLAAAGRFSEDAHFCVAGYRKNRRDSGWRKFQSRVANNIRRALLKDATPDTGCALKVIPRHTWLEMPYFDHMHRFLPALVQRMGGEVVVEVVNHRPRLHDTSKYGMWGRLGEGVVDLFGVIWLIRRARTTETKELTSADS